MADDKIGYDYGVLFDGVSKMQGVNREVEQLIQSLSRETGQALDTWSGPAAVHYNQLSSRIEQNFADMNTIVHELAKELKIRSEDMQQQDIRSGNRFGR